MERSFLNKIYQAHRQCPECPSPKVVSSFFKELLGTLFPEFSRRTFSSEEELEMHVRELKLQLGQLLTKAPNKESGNKVPDILFENLPIIYEKLQQDITAMYEGDPAAKSLSEVIRTYPGFYAIAAYRIAHELYKLKVQIIPRMISEHAHSMTGIDIHPGARIGRHFCIDHGTGIVIGETAEIGDYVKVYQGVTIGALSISKEDAEKKRHPTIEDHVVLYAGATILGGETRIGEHSVIGGNVWVTQSLPAHSKVYYQAKMYNKDTDQTDLIIYKTKT
jgi:serine O-acetyltransferase